MDRKDYIDIKSEKFGLTITDVPITRSGLKGGIFCTKCDNAMKKQSCKCGHTICHVMVYWQGKPRRFYKSPLDGETLNYKRAVKLLTEINHAINKGTFNPEYFKNCAINERKFENQIEKWLEDFRSEVKVGAKAPETLRIYTSWNKTHFLPFFKGYGIREIRYEQINAFKRFLGARVRINTRKRIMAGLHTFFMWALREGIIENMVVFPKMNGEDTVKRAFDIEFQNEILKKIPEKHKDLFQFGMETGLRPNELCAIQVGDIDFQKRTAIIQHGYSGQVFHNNTKGRSKMSIALSDKAFVIAQRNSRDKLPGVFLFINPDAGRGYMPRTLDGIWAKHVGRDIAKNEFMRHSFITQLFEMGLPAEIVQVFSRHRDKNSLKNYTHINPVKLRDIVNNRGRVISLTERVPSEKNEAK